MHLHPVEPAQAFAEVVRLTAPRVGDAPTTLIGPVVQFQAGRSSGRFSLGPKPRQLDRGQRELHDDGSSRRGPGPVD